MPDQHEQQGTVAVHDIDFDAVYRGERVVDGSNAKFDVVPWDIGEPQPEITALERAGGIQGEVLDAGCGLGDNAIYLAQRGYSVTGVDGSETAITQARQRARDHGVAPELAVADATRLAGFEQRFDTVLDSALYHCLPDEQRADYGAALHRVARPGASLHVFCFADTASGPPPGPPPISQDNLRERLGQHWSIDDIELVYYTSAMTPQQADEMLRQYEFDKIGLDIQPDALSTDEHGRLLLPVWHLRAHRA